MSEFNSFYKEDALHSYRNAWKSGIDKKFYADDIVFYARRLKCEATILKQRQQNYFN